MRCGAARPAEFCFNPRLPGGRRRRGPLVLRTNAAVSIHAFRGEGDDTDHLHSLRPHVSIHAFRGEGDLARLSDTWRRYAVSIHAFRGEGDFEAV